MKKINYGKHNVTDEDIESVIYVLKSDYLTQGPKVREFEQKFANYVGSKFAVAVSNGTAALHLAALSLNVKPGQKVITTPITFCATANCIRFCNADIVFVDIDPNTYLLDINKVEDLLKKYPLGTFSGIIVVNLGGRMNDLEKFSDLSKKYRCWLIEDACHSVGGYFIDSRNQFQMSGNGKFANISVFSFHPVKHIACGEGGMLTTNDESLYKKILLLRSHGITKDEKQFLNSKEFALGHIENSESTDYPKWYMEMQFLGYNYRITDIQSALGISQLKRIKENLKKRREIAKRYYEFFKDKEYIIRQSGIVEGHAYHLYIIEVEKRLELYKHLEEKGIYCQIHYIPCHLMPYYRNLGWKEGDLYYAEKYYQNCLSLPIYPTLSESEQNYIMEQIDKFFN